MEIDARLAEEAIRLFRRYSVEMVEGFGLCPWARGARREGHVCERVLAHTEQAVVAIDELAADENVEIGILLFPVLDMDRATFERAVAKLREQRPAPFAMADFHPAAPAVLQPAGAFTSFVRRTPDPTIQLVRKSALDHVRRGDKNHGSGFFDLKMIDTLVTEPTSDEPPLHERVLESNRKTVEEHGLAEIARRFDDIRRDRDATYSRILGVAR
jgi:hypothetical protein